MLRSIEGADCVRNRLYAPIAAGGREMSLKVLMDLLSARVCLRQTRVKRSVQDFAGRNFRFYPAQNVFPFVEESPLS